MIFGDDVIDGRGVPDLFLTPGATGRANPAWQTSAPGSETPWLMYGAIVLGAVGLGYLLARK